MIATDDERHELAGDELAHLRFDRSAHGRAVEWWEHDIARIDAAQAREHVDVVYRMMVLQQRRYASHVIRRETRARLVRGAAVVRNAEQCDVRVGDIKRRRETEERSLTVT